MCFRSVFFQSNNCDEILKIRPKELNVRGSVYDILEGYLNF